MAGVLVLSRTSRAVLTWRGRAEPMAMFSTIASDAKLSSTLEVKPFHEIPGPRGLYQIPILGTLLHFKPFTNLTTRESQTFLNKLLDTYGPIVRLQLGSQCVVISDPNDLETVYKNEGKYPERPPFEIEHIYCKRAKQGLGFTELRGEDWYTRRATLNKRIMKIDSATYYLDAQNSVTDDFVDIIEHEDLDPKAMDELFFRFTAEAIGVVCFNSRLGFLDMKSKDPEIKTVLVASRDVFLYLHQSVSGESLAHTWYRNATYRAYERATNIIRENTVKHMRAAQKLLEQRKVEGTLRDDEPNLLHSLLSDSTIKIEDLDNMIQALYVGGTDSTAKNMQTLFYNLALNPDKQEKLREEVLRVLGPDGPLTKESLARLHYTKACLKESFRLHYPVATGSRRILPQDIVLSGYRVPAGTVIWLHNPKICQDYFVDADKFVPERWLRNSVGRREEDIPKIALLPFGYGSRNCLGRRFAEQEIYLGITKVLQRLRIGVKPESKNVAFNYAMFVQPVEPIKFTFTKL